METLNQEQTNWIFLQARNLTDRYMALWPLTEEQWLRMRGDIGSIVKKSKDNPLCRKIMLAVFEAFDEMYHAEYLEGEHVDGM